MSFSAADRNSFPMTHAQDLSVRMTTPAENYRCPVSTPANQYVQRHARIRRTKPMTVLYSQPTTTSVTKGERARGFPLSRHSRAQHSKQMLQPGKSLDYYFVDKNDDKQVEEQTNTYWLKALCSQPVEEILKKYRRKSDAKSTRVIWSKTFTTPGERSLLQAWDSRTGHVMSSCRVRVDHVQSAYDATSRRRLGQKSGKLLVRRQTQSEPPLSRAQNLDLVSGSVTPVTMQREEDSRYPGLPPAMAADSPLSPKLDDTHATTVQKTQITVLSAADHSPRVKSYTTQYFAPKPGIQRAVRVRVVTSPEHLPVLCTRHRVANLIQEEQNSHDASNV